MESAEKRPLHDENGKFAVGHEKIGGREKGTPNKVNALDLRMWAEKTLEAISELKDAQRAEKLVTVFTALLTKIPNLPSTPGESRENAEKIQDIERLEQIKPSEIKENADVNG